MRYILQTIVVNTSAAAMIIRTDADSRSHVEARMYTSMQEELAW